jgi:hypothetical protein
MIVRAFAQRASQRRYVHRQISLLDGGVRPDSFHQFRLFNQVATVFHEHEEQVEGFRSERHGLITAQKLSLFRDKSEWTEFVDAPYVSDHEAPYQSLLALWRYFGGILAILKDVQAAAE